MDDADFAALVDGYNARPVPDCKGAKKALRRLMRKFHPDHCVKVRCRAAVHLPGWMTARTGVVLRPCTCFQFGTPNG